MNFFKALFGGKEDTPEEKKNKSVERNFDVLKYDGVRAMKGGQFDYAVQCFVKALELKTDAETMSHLATTYISQNELTKAYATLENLTEICPDDANIYITMAQVAFLQKNYQTMCDVCQKAFLIDDKDPHTYFLFARGNHGLNDDITAVAMLTKAIMLKEDFYDAYLLRAQVLTEMSQLKEAEEDVDFLLEKIPGQEDSLLLKAQIRAENNDAEGALACYHQAIDTNPFCCKAYLQEATLLAATGKKAEAVERLGTAIENMTDFADAYKLRGEIKRDMGDEQGSVDDLKKALELAPEEAKHISGEFKSVQQQVEETYKNVLNPYGI